MRLSAMGDVAMTVPVIRAFVAQYPKVKIVVISVPFFKPFFDDIPNVTFFPFEVNNRHKGVLGLFRLFQDLKELKIDAFADLHDVLRSKFLRTLFKSGGQLTAFVDKGRSEKTALIRPNNKILEPIETMFQRHAKVFEELGFPIDLSSPTFLPKKKLDAITLGLTGEKSQKWIGIAPFAQYDSKVYPFDLMQEVIYQLAQNEAYKLFLFGGGKKEIELLDSLSNQVENVINIAGKINFKQELQLISNLDIMLSMDSGNAHIAAMQGIKVITLWGATHPFAGFSPFNQPLENALVSDRNLFPKLPTSVYGNKEVEGYESAMRTILPINVVEKITTSLK
jgi:ADP-heptose:LPS heptosyltransferase